MRGTVRRGLAVAVLPAALVLGSACNAILGNQDATATHGDGGNQKDTGPVHDGSSDSSPGPDSTLGGDGGGPDASDGAPPSDGGLVILNMDSDDPRAVAVDSTSFYWIDAHSVLDCPLGGCVSAPNALATGAGNLVSILADGQHLAWTDSSKQTVDLCTVSPGPCLPCSLALPGGDPRGVATDSSNLYWTDRAAGNVGGIMLTARCLASNAFTMVSGLVAPAAMTSDDGGNVYWTEGAEAGAVSGCMIPAFIGCNAVQLTPTQTVPAELAADTNDLYFTLPLENRVVDVTGAFSSGMAIHDVATQQNAPTYLAIDAMYVYWVDLDGLKRCPRSPGTCGTSPTLLTPLPQMPGGIAVAAGVVYGALRALDLSGNPLSTGAVYRFVAPP